MDKVLRFLVRFSLVRRFARVVCLIDDLAIREEEIRTTFKDTSTKNLLDFKEIMDEIVVPFWLAFGTFLGAYREGGFIPLDGDIDIAIREEDLFLISSNVKRFADKGFELRVNYMKGAYRSGLYRGGERIGLAPFSKGGDKRVWKQISYDDCDFNGNKVSFLGEDFSILNNPEKWLKYTYGDDWMIPIDGKGVGGGIPYGIEEG